MLPEQGSVLDGLPPQSRLAIVRLRSMGDCVLTTPAIEILRNTRPDLSIGVVVEPRFAAVFEDNPAVPFILKPSSLEILRFRPRLCLNLHGGNRSMLLTLASLAPVRAGFAHHRGARVYNVHIPRAQQILGEERPVHTAEHLATAMFYLGCPRQEIPRAQLFSRPKATGNPYAVIHATAAAAYKTWHAEGFAVVADHIEDRYDLEPIFIGSAGDDMAPFSRFRTVAGASLSTVRNLIAGASLYVGNDSGPAHMAAAFDVPLVVLFGRPEHSVTWAPWKAAHAHSLVSDSGIRSIRPGEVIEAVDQVAADAGL